MEGRGDTCTEREREEKKEEDRSGREGDEKGSGRERNMQNVYH